LQVLHWHLQPFIALVLVQVHPHEAHITSSSLP
jgi:hypothetical protein